MKTSIKKHLNNISSPASNRSIKIKNKGLVSVRYLNCSFKEAYRTFELRKDISFSSFFKYIPSLYKKPHRLKVFENLPSKT